MIPLHAGHTGVADNVQALFWICIVADDIAHARIVRASLFPEPFNLMTVVPDKVMLPLTAMVPVAFAPVVMPIVVFVPAGESVAPDETVRLPLIRPMPPKV